MVVLAVGKVVTVPFPFSDLTQAKVRPALVLAHAGGDDWILCQVTSNAYGDPQAVSIDKADFASGFLRLSSFARPAKLFTASQDLIVNEVGDLRPKKHRQIIDAVVTNLNALTANLVRSVATRFSIA